MRQLRIQAQIRSPAGNGPPQGHHRTKARDIDPRQL